MAHICIPVKCRCGARAVWSAHLGWLGKEGMDLTRFMDPSFSPKNLPLPREAVDVTEKFHLRCGRCFELMPVFPMLRGHVAAGVGIVIGGPSLGDQVEPRRPKRSPPSIPSKGARLTGQDGRRARRIGGVAETLARASVMFDLKLVDISPIGLSAEHAHAIQVGDLYTLQLRLANQAEAVRVNARAVWTTSCRIEQRRGARKVTFRSGFEFITLDLGAVSALETYLRERAR